MADCICIDETVVAISSATAGGIGIVTATWPAFNCTFDGQTYHVATGSINYNAADVATPTTYYMYFELVAGVPTAKVSTTNPSVNPLVDEFFVANIVRFKSVATVVTIYFNKYPSQNGVYELAHNLKGDVMFYDPLWISGIAPTLAAGGKVSTDAGYVRFPGNEPRVVTAITNGALMLDDESATVVGLDNIATYADGSAIANGDFVKLLVGVVRDRSSLNAARLRVMRQAKPTAPYASAADAWADAESCAATSFGLAYRAAVTPLFYIVTEMTAGATSDYTQTGATPTGDIVDLRETGLTGAGGGGGAGVTSHSSLSDLGNDDHAQYLRTDGTRALSGNWNAGAKSITTTSTLSGSQIISTIADGTKPFDVISKTVSTNLNADMVDGVHGPFVEADGTQALTADWDAGAFEIRALTFESDVAPGAGAPFTVASTDLVTNLNADQLDGHEATAFVHVAGDTMSGNLAMGGKDITGAGDFGGATATLTGAAEALTFESTQTTGTAPFTVASTTVVTSLNADQLDGNHAAAFAVAAKGVTNGDTHDHAGGDGGQIAHSGLSGLTTGDDHTQYLLADGTRALTGNWAAGAKNITTTGNLSGSTLIATLASGGAAPMTITSTTKVTNLNADMLDGLHDTAFLKADGSVTATGNFSVNAGVTFDGVDVGDHAANANAHHNAVTLGDNVAAGLLQLSTQVIELDTQTANYVFAGPTTGAATYPAFRALVAADIPVNPSAALTLANTGNDDVALSTNKSVFYITGPTANFSVTGFALSGGNVDGTVIRLHNGTAKTMTLTNDATSVAANRLYSGGATVTAGRGCTFIYNSSVSRWLIVD